MKFFVLNATEEFICDVAAEPSLDETQKVVVETYTRDPDILTSNYSLTCKLHHKKEEDKHRFLTFVKYLKERQKVFRFLL